MNFSSRRKYGKFLAEKREKWFFPKKGDKHFFQRKKGAVTFMKSLTWLSSGYQNIITLDLQVSGINWFIPVHSCCDAVVDLIIQKAKHNHLLTIIISMIAFLHYRDVYNARTPDYERTSGMIISQWYCCNKSRIQSTVLSWKIVGWCCSLVYNFLSATMEMV